MAALDQEPKWRPDCRDTLTYHRQTHGKRLCTNTCPLPTCTWGQDRHTYSTCSRVCTRMLKHRHHVLLCTQTPQYQTHSDAFTILTGKVRRSTHTARAQTPQHTLYTPVSTTCQCLPRLPHAARCPGEGSRETMRMPPSSCHQEAVGA